MDSCAETSVSTDFCIFCKNLIPSRSALPCSTLRVSLETEGNGQYHPFAPWPEYKKRSRRCSLRLRFYSFSRLQPHAAPYCRPNQRQRFTFEASGGRTKPDSPPTPRRVPPPERPSALRWFGSVRRAAIPPFHTVGVPSSFPTRHASAARQQGPMSRFP